MNAQKNLMARLAAYFSALQVLTSLRLKHFTDNSRELDCLEILIQ